MRRLPAATRLNDWQAETLYKNKVKFGMSGVYTVEFCTCPDVESFGHQITKI